MKRGAEAAAVEPPDAEWACTMCGVPFESSEELQAHWSEAHAVTQAAYEA